MGCVSYVLFSNRLRHGWRERVGAPLAAWLWGMGRVPGGSGLCILCCGGLGRVPLGEGGTGSPLGEERPGYVDLAR